MDDYLEIKSRASQDQKVLNSLILLFYYLIFTSLIYICYYNVSAHQHRKIGKLHTNIQFLAFFEKPDPANLSPYFQVWCLCQSPVPSGPPLPSVVLFVSQCQSWEPRVFQPHKINWQDFALFYHLIKLKWNSHFS